MRETIKGLPEKNAISKAIRKDPKSSFRKKKVKKLKTRKIKTGKGSPLVMLTAKSEIPRAQLEQQLMWMSKNFAEGKPVIMPLPPGAQVTILSSMVTGVDMQYLENKPVKVKKEGADIQEIKGGESGGTYILTFKGNFKNQGESHVDIDETSKCIPLLTKKSCKVFTQ